MAARIALAARRANRGIAAANLEPQVIATTAVVPALRVCLASQSQNRQHERGPQPDRKLHARPLEFESRSASSRQHVNAPTGDLQERISERCRRFVLEII